MKRLAVALCLFGSMITYGQRTIEVKIQDTIQLEVTSADLILVIYGMYSDEASYDYLFDTDDSENLFEQELTRKQKREIKRLNRKLKKQFAKMYGNDVEEELLPNLEVEAPIETEAPAEPILDEGQSDFEFRKSHWLEWLESSNIPLDTLDTHRSGYSEEGTYTILLPGLTAEQINLVYWKASQIEDNELYTDKISYASMESKRDAVNIQMLKEALREAASLAKALNVTTGAIIRVYNPEWEEISCSRGWDEEETEYSTQPTGRCLLMQKTFVFEIK
jgi:hypothetical protein